MSKVRRALFNLQNKSFVLPASGSGNGKKDRFRSLRINLCVLFAIGTAGVFLAITAYIITISLKNLL